MISSEYFYVNGARERVAVFEEAVRLNKPYLAPKKSYPIDQSRLSYMLNYIDYGGPLVPHETKARTRPSPFRDDTFTSVKVSLAPFIYMYGYSIVHVPYSQFCTSLRRAVNQFVRENPTPYILWKSPYTDKSNYWAANIALPFFTTPPYDVWETFPELDLPPSGKVLNLVLVDDAIYSGQQMVDNLEQIDEVVGIVNNFLGREIEFNVYIIVGYIARKGVRALDDAKFNNINSIGLYYGEILKSVGESGPNYRNILPEELSSKYLYYFDHKLPDGVSIDIDFIEGMGVVQEDGTVGIIEGCYSYTEDSECPYPPYKLVKLK